MVRSPVTLPVFSPVFSNFVLLKVISWNFLLALHVLIEYRNERLDAVGREGHADCAVLRARLIIKKLAIKFEEMRALVANAHMVPAEADLGVVFIENISLRRGQGSRGKRKQCKGRKGRKAKDHCGTPMLVNLPLAGGLAWRLRKGKTRNSACDHKSLFSVVMAGLEPAIQHHIAMSCFCSWMVASSAVMTAKYDPR
jgi:hypothetical protein